MNKNLLHLYFLLFVSLLAGCSVERKNPLSKAYHNTTARYNGYFLAKEKMNAIEKSIQDQMVYDYNLALPIYPTIDSTTFKAHEAELEDVIKKASHPIQYHKNSKWIDDSYILIGKARYYQLSFAEAAKTFKYVNTTSTDRHARHEALVWLMRSFLKTEEYDNAWAVSEALRKERLNRDNARELYLARAQYHYLQGDTAAMVDNLALSIRNFKKRDDQSRTRFSLARLYQRTGQNKEAYTQYNRILRRNPPYDLGFFSRLYLGQVTEFSDVQDIARVAGYYKKMLKDSKNTEYQDKIYYEMAVFELRQQHYDKSLELLNQSLRTEGTLANQKAYSYLLAGEIYFENLHKYNLAQAYYDSAVQVFPQNAPGYSAVQERKNILTDFVAQYNTIQTQDSLQRLARLSERERMEYLHQLVTREEEQRQEEALRQQEKQERDAQRAQRQQNFTVNSNQNNTAFAANNNNSSGVWYFDNPSAMATARSEFVRRWGNRPLQDNWRLRTRSETNERAPLAQMPESTTADEPVQSANERMEAQVQAYLKNIPLTTVALQQSERQVEDALFNLGNIYNQKLQDNARATEVYEQLLKRFPKTEYAPEVNYSLYLIYDKASNNQKKSIYYHTLKQQFPNTIYAKLVDDAGYRTKNAADNVRAHALYDSAYTHYVQHQYKEAATLLAQLESQYPLNDIKDKVAFLNVMIVARTEKPQVLHNQLQRFKTNYPGSPLQAQADQLLATYNNLEQKNQLREDAPAIPPVAVKAQPASIQLSEPKLGTETATATASLIDTATLPKLPEEQKQLIPQKEQQPVIAPEQTKVKEEAKVEKPVTQPVITVADSAAPAEMAAPTAEKTEEAEYITDADSAYYFVLVYPTSSPAFKDVEARYAKYNHSFYRAEGLILDSLNFENGKTLLIARSFSDLKVAKTYNIKQKGPQAPIGRIRGVDFTTFVISSANFEKFLQKKDLDTYLNFFRNNY